MDIPEKQVDAKSAELIEEFYAHLEEYKKLHSENQVGQEEVFQGWVIQKIAGLQLSIMEIAKSINAFIESYEEEKKNS